jgi:hypothetical protein
MFFINLKWGIENMNVTVELTGQERGILEVVKAIGQADLDDDAILFTKKQYNKVFSKQARCPFVLVSMIEPDMMDIVPPIVIKCKDEREALEQIFYVFDFHKGVNDRKRMRFINEGLA